MDIIKNLYHCLKIGEMCSQVARTMKAAIFCQVWYLHCFNVVDLDVMNTTRQIESKMAI